MSGFEMETLTAVLPLSYSHLYCTVETAIKKDFPCSNSYNESKEKAVRRAQWLVAGKICPENWI